MEEEVSAWMKRIGFRDNSTAETSIFRVDPFASLPPIVTEVLQKYHPNWGRIEDLTLITPEIAMLFYILVGGAIDD